MATTTKNNDKHNSNNEISFFKSKKLGTFIVNIILKYNFF